MSLIQLDENTNLVELNQVGWIPPNSLNQKKIFYDFILRFFGHKTVINANATLTKLGGSLMPEEVIQAMVEASKTFVDIHQLQQTVGQRLAEINSERSRIRELRSGDGFVAGNSSMH